MFTPATSAFSSSIAARNVYYPTVEKSPAKWESMQVESNFHWRATVSWHNHFECSANHVDNMWSQAAGDLARFTLQRLRYTTNKEVFYKCTSLISVCQIRFHSAKISVTFSCMLAQMSVADRMRRQRTLQKHNTLDGADEGITHSTCNWMSLP